MHDSCRVDDLQWFRLRFRSAEERKEKESKKMLSSAFLSLSEPSWEDILLRLVLNLQIP